MATTYILRLSVESKTGHSWTAVQDTLTGIRAAAAWRDEIKAWCVDNPLPEGYRYRVPLPRTVTPAQTPAWDVNELRAEATRACEEASSQALEADYWRESYRLAMGLSHDEIGAIIAVRDASKSHRRPCRFPYKVCICEDQP